MERGVACSVTSASLVGRFGRTVRRFAIAMLQAGLVHDISSDAHDLVGRTPDLAAGLRAVESEVPGAVESQAWFTEVAPAAILAGDELPPAPQFSLRGGLAGRFLRRVSKPPRRSG